MSITRDNWVKPLKMPRSCIFNDAEPGIRVLTKKYFLNTDLVHEHDFFELVLVRSGTGLHVTETGEYPLGRGDIYLVKPGCLHSYRELDALEIVNILYLPERLALPLSDLRGNSGYVAFFEASPRLAGALGGRRRLRLGDEEMARADTFLEEMMREQDRRRTGYGFAMTAIFMQLIVLVTRAAAGGGDEDGELIRTGRMLAFLEKHCAEPIQISDIARECGVSIRTLERFFLDSTGCTPAAYLAGLRLNKGAELLLESELPVSRVANRVGFSDSGYFARIFRRKFNCSPREYRRRFTAGGGKREE